MSYYLPVPGTRDYQVVDVLPPGVKARHAFVAVEPYVAHAKPYGIDTKKPLEVTVYAASNEELLFKYNDPVKKYGGLYSCEWDTCYFHQTTEGYRFVRSVVKVMKVLVSVSKKAIIERNKIERNRKAAKAREGREGTCQICEGRQIIQPTGENKGTLVLHGYNRPGWGHTVGQCLGYHELPFEVSCDALKGYVKGLRYQLASLKTSLLELPSRTTFITEAPYPSKGNIEIDSSDPRFHQVMEHKKRELEYSIKTLGGEIEYQEGRLAQWHKDHQ